MRKTPTCSLTWPPGWEPASYSTWSKGWQRGQRRWQGMVGRGDAEGMRLLKRNQKTALSHVYPSASRALIPSLSLPALFHHRCPTPSWALSLHALPSSVPRRSRPPRGPTLAKTHDMQNNEQQAWEAGKLQGQELQRWEARRHAWFYL